VQFEGRYVQRSPTLPDQIDLSFDRVALSDLENVLMPVLRREPGFFARTLPFRRGVVLPGWLSTRKLEGTMRAKELILGEAELQDVRGHLAWNGSQVELQSVEANYGGAAVHAAVAADLSDPLPRYTLGARLVDLPWRSGLVGLQAAAETGGTGLDLMLNLRTEGSFQIRSCSLTPDHALRTASGTFGLAWTRTGPRLKLTGVQASIDGERYAGEGATRADGHLQLELASPQRMMRLAGSLAPLKLEVMKLEVTPDRPVAR
jgi:hypothetical protein